MYSLPGLLIALSAFFVFGCGKEHKRLDNESPLRLEANLLMDNQLFQHTVAGRNWERTFEVKEIFQENDALKVVLKGGDSAASFQFIWDGRVQESAPMGIQLIVLYNGAYEDFDPGREVTVSVNLQKIIGEQKNVNDYRFNVINGSKIQTVTLDPDGTTTSHEK